MSTHKKIDLICILAVLFSMILTVLFMNSSAFGILPVISVEANGMFTANDLNADWDTSSATKILLSDQGSTISGNGAYVYDGDIYIIYGGHYVLTGELSNGSIIINAEKTDNIWISLDGVTLHCEEDAALRIEQANKVFLTLAEGTESTLSSGAQYQAEVIASGVDGVIYSRDDLTINGNGSLVVTANYSHGIVCNDDLVITGGTFTIEAVEDGIHANDSVRIQNATLSISAGDDGITVSNDDETAFLYIESGSITIPSCYEGLEAATITIAGGTLDITSTDDGINANGSGANSVIRITDGDITITNPSGRDADGLDSNGSIYIEGGRIFISVTDNGGNSALDYGSENGGECVIYGGTVIACGSSMMAEGFDSSSTQGFLMYQTTAEAETTVQLKDALGGELLSEKIPYSFSSIVISTPELSIGDLCTLEIGDRQEQITIDNSTASAFGSGFRGGRVPQGGISGNMPDSGSPDANQSNPSNGDTSEMGVPDGEPPNGSKPFMDVPDGNTPEDSMPAMGTPDSAMPNADMSETGMPEANMPEDATFGKGRPDADMLEGNVSGAGIRNGKREGFDTEWADQAQTPKNDMRFSQTENQTESDRTPLALLGISVLTLFLGLIFAVKFRY